MPCVAESEYIYVALAFCLHRKVDLFFTLLPNKSYNEITCFFLVCKYYCGCQDKNNQAYNASQCILKKETKAGFKHHLLVTWAGFASASIAMYTIQADVCCSDQSVSENSESARAHTHRLSLSLFFPAVTLQFPSGSKRYLSISYWNSACINPRSARELCSSECVCVCVRTRICMCVCANRALACLCHLRINETLSNEACCTQPGKDLHIWTSSETRSLVGLQWGKSENGLSSTNLPSENPLPCPHSAPHSKG